MRLLALLPLVALALVPAASAGTTKPCLLVTTDDAAKVLGGKVGAGKAQTLGLYKSCFYKRGTKTLTVQTRLIAKAAFEKSAKKNPPPVFPIPGIGQEAFSVGGGAALLVWQKGTELTFLFVGVNPFVQTQKDLASAALKRL
jgi:hypothetical protein